MTRLDHQMRRSRSKAHHRRKIHCRGRLAEPADGHRQIWRPSYSCASAEDERGSDGNPIEIRGQCSRQGGSYAISGWGRRKRRLGVETRLNALVNGDAVVVCAGVGSRQFAAMLGDRVNVYPVKGYSITVNLEGDKSQESAPWVSLLDDRAKIVTSRLGKVRFRVAGTAEFNGHDRNIRSDRIRPLTDWVRWLFPNVSTSRVEPWSRLRPMMPNMMPVVRQGKRPGVFYNTGHGHLGWTLSAATSELVSDLIDSSRRRGPPS